MNAGIAAYVILSQNTDVTDIVGVNIFPEVAEQETATPFIVYQLLSVAPEDTHDGPSTLDEVRFEFLCYADSYALAADLGSKVRGALDRVSGTYNGVNVESIQFNDVDIDTIDAPRRFAQVLTFTFRIKRDNVEIAQGTPVTGAKLGDLYDVDTTGVTDGQVIAYDAAAQEWQPADDAGGVTELSQLDDVTLNNTAQGELLKYDGNDWVNDTIDKSDVSLGNVDNTSDADKPISTATQTALDDKADSSDVPTELDDLSDVKIIGAPSAGQSLVYNSGFFQLGQAGATTLGALDDVNTVGAAFGSLLAYNGSTGWDISAAALPTDDIYFHQRYVTESEALRSGATATVELYFACTAQGNGLAESASSDTPTAGKIIKRKIYYSEAAFADPDTGTWVEFTPAPADDASFATVKAALLEYLKARTGGTVPISLKQTWEEVDEAPAFTGLLNETYGSGAEAAYSTRRLNGNVTDCMVIRRASDSTTTTIGFDGSGNISEADIETFCTGTSCTVYQWLDQSGNGNTATAAAPANEPTIYTAGALVKQDGRVGIDFDGSANVLVNTTVSITDYDFSIVNVNVHPATNGVPSGLYLDTASNIYYQHSAIGGSGTFNNRLQARVGGTTGQGYTDAIEGQRNLNYLNFISATSRDITVNGVESGSNNTNVAFTAPNSLSIGAMNDTSPGGYFDGIAQEVILFGATKSGADQTSVEENIGDYFTQNTPLLDTYTGAAAAYSLRKLSSSYSGSAVEVYNGSSYADIGFNVFSELDTVALAAHCGSNDGFVSKWYCQSGNSNDAVQTNTGSMPKIYDGATTSVVTENGKPALYFGGAQYIDAPSIGANVATFFAVHDNGGSTANMLGMFDRNDNSFIYDRGTYMQFRPRAGSWSTTATSQIDFKSWYLLSNGSSSEAAVNDQTPDAGSTSTIGRVLFRLGLRTANYFTGHFYELVIYTSDESSNRTGVNNNINTFYNIYS